jgi:uncharacterized protein
MELRAFGKSLAAAVLALILCGVAPAAAQPKPPELTNPVNDFAGVIDQNSSRLLDKRIRALLAASGDAIVVATVNTFKPWGDIRGYATAMFENHGRGIGAKGKDNGLLVLLAVEDRQVWIEVGYDLEGIVTDGFAGETSRQVMAPRFREGAYGTGLLDGTSRIIGRIAEARQVSIEGVQAPPRSAMEGTGRGFQFVLFALVIVALIIVASIKGRGGPQPPRRWRGGVGPWGGPYYGGHWGGGTTWRGSSGGFGGFGGGRSGGGGGGASW